MTRQLLRYRTGQRYLRCRIRHQHTGRGSRGAQRDAAHRGAPGATAPGAPAYAVYGCGAGQRWYSRVRHKTRRMVFPLVCIGLRVRQLPALSLPPSCTHNTRRGCLRGSHTAARPSTCHMRRGVQAHTREKVRPTLPLQQHFREKPRPASRKTPILGCFQRAGRTFSRSHPHQAARGELFRAKTARRTAR